jgi:hypothetical protein
VKFYVVDDGSTNLTYRYAPNGAAGSTSALGTGNTAPRGVVSTIAGDKTWVIDANRKVYVYSASGLLLGSWTAGSLPNNGTPEGVATNGTDVWIVDAKSDKVFRYSGAASRLTGSQNAASSFNLNSGNANPKDIVTDGQSLWVVNDAATDKVFKYSVAGSLQGSWTISGAGSQPTGITIDPANVSDIWIVDNGTDRVYQFVGASSRTSGSQASATSFALAPGNTNPQGIADPPASSTGGTSLESLRADAAVSNIITNSSLETGAATTRSSRPPRGRFNPCRSGNLATDDVSMLNLNLLNVATPAASAAIVDTIHAASNVETNDIQALDSAFAAFKL